MKNEMESHASSDSDRPSAWSAVYSMALGVAGLIISEFLPAGMLTPMASSFGISEGTTGQAVTAASTMAVIASLAIAFVTRRFNRKTVLLGLSVILCVSNLLVAVAPSFSFLIAGRLLMGVAVGGFWSMAAAITLRLVPFDLVPRALAIVFGASSFSQVLAAPLGSYLSGIIGWRNVFFIAAFVSFIALIWQAVTLPSLKPMGVTKLRTLIDVMRVPQFAVAMLAAVFTFGGRFASFTYIRPFLEKTTHAGPNAVSLILLLFGIATFLGTSSAGFFTKQNLIKPLWLLPLTAAVLGIGLLVFGGSLLLTAPLIVLWGFTFGPLPVSYSTWIARKVPENAETGGGLYVAAIQLSAALGAMLGGLTFDGFGSAGVFSLSSLSLVIGAGLVWIKLRAPKVV